MRAPSSERCEPPRPSRGAASVLPDPFAPVRCGRGQAEKVSRGALKTAVERGLTKAATLICDDLNYIKGYRYELFCIARAVGTTMCTIHCDASQEQIEEFNRTSGAYDERHIRELPTRFERPNDRNRWER